LKSLQEIENYFLFIAEQLYKLDYQHQKNIINIVKKFETHKSRSQLVTDIEGDIKDTSVALKSLLSIYLKNVYLKSFNDTHKEYSIKKLFALQELQKEDLKVTGGFLDEVTPYNLSFLEQFFATYETPFLKGWEDEQKKAIFGFLEELMMTGYSYDRAERGLRKLLGENPYGMDNKTYWEMVGRTEATRVFTQASLASAKSLGYTMKRVKTVVGCERCKEFEAQGAIPINQPYENTLPNNPDIPFHPNCMCHYQYELEQGKYFSQYSYEPDKKLKTEANLLDYNADLSKMNEEQLQRWADTHLKTPVDLSFNINELLSNSDIYQFYIDNILGENGDLTNLRENFKKWVEENFLETQRDLILNLKILEQKYGRMPVTIFRFKLDVNYEGKIKNLGGYNNNEGFVEFLPLKAIYSAKSYQNYEWLDGITELLPFHSNPNFSGTIYHEIAHAFDFYYKNQMEYILQYNVNKDQLIISKELKNLEKQKYEFLKSKIKYWEGKKSFNDIILSVEEANMNMQIYRIDKFFEKETLTYDELLDNLIKIETDNLSNFLRHTDLVNFYKDLEEFKEFEEQIKMKEQEIENYRDSLLGSLISAVDKTPEDLGDRNYWGNISIYSREKNYGGKLDTVTYLETWAEMFAVWEGAEQGDNYCERVINEKWTKEQKDIMNYLYSKIEQDLEYYKAGYKNVPTFEETEKIKKERLKYELYIRDLEWW